MLLVVLAVVWKGLIIHRCEIKLMTKIKARAPQNFRLDNPS